MLGKGPGFTLAAILSLAIGIGANTSIFSIINALLLRPLPYLDAERLAILWNRSPGPQPLRRLQFASTHGNL
jgi:hypothetical protein